MPLPILPRRPAYQISIGGQPLAALGPRLLSLTLTDRRGLEADQLDIDLTDADGRLKLPARGAALSLALGWTGALIDRGYYIVDEIEHHGPPDTLTIRARSADVRAGPLTIRRDQSYHDTTLGAILSTIAARHSLQPAIAPALASRPIAHEDQTKESDLALLTRLAEEHGAMATIKAGRLVFAVPGAATSASGTPIPPIIIPRTSIDTHRYALSERDAFSGVIAEFEDRDTREKREAVAGSEDNPKRLRHTYADEASALDAARAELARIDRGLARLDLSLVEGMADLACETPVTVAGIKPEIDAHAWICTEATHRLSDAGYLTTCSLEAPGTAE